MHLSTIIFQEFNLKKKNLLDFIKNKILEINPEYKFKYLDGEIKKDVLCAYI